MRGDELNFNKIQNITYNYNCKTKIFKNNFEFKCCNNNNTVIDFQSKFNITFLRKSLKLS